MRLTDTQKFMDDFITGVGTVNEKEVVVSYTIYKKSLAIVLGFIESDDSLDIHSFENVYIFFRHESGPLARLSLVNRTHKSHKLTRNYPVQVSILNALVMLVLFDIKVLEVVPIMFDCELESLQTMQYSAVKVTVSFGRISEWSHTMLVTAEFT